MRSRAAVGLLLLVITAHAFVAGATHFHVSADSRTSQAAIHGEESGRPGVPLSGDDAQCLLCRLQRSFVSDLQGATLALTPPSADAPSYASPRNVTTLASRSLLPSGRGPPSV